MKKIKGQMYYTKAWDRIKNGADPVVVLRRAAKHAYSKEVRESSTIIRIYAEDINDDVFHGRYSDALKRLSDVALCDFSTWIK